jgi:hypothetical protein
VVIAVGGVSELVAARAAKAYGLERARLVLISGGADADSMVTAIGGALGDLKPADVTVSWLASLTGGRLAFDSRTRGGRRVRGPLRAAFQVVEFGRALSSGGPEARTVSFVQAVRFGKDLTLVTAGGCSPRAEREVMAAEPGGAACTPEIEEALGRLMRGLGAR